MRKKPLSPSQIYRTGQAPAMWFRSAERLRNAAEIIIADQRGHERPYFQAVNAAGTEAASKAASAPSGSASVEILCEPPNYLPAELLYAFAIENALKGLILKHNPEWIQPGRLSKRVKSHDLIALAEDAEFRLGTQEVPVLKALSHIAEWAGRYPVAAALNDYQKTGNPHPIALVADAPLDWDLSIPLCAAALIELFRNSGRNCRANRYASALWSLFRRPDFTARLTDAGV